ncbi:MAG: DUF423 domain-containing protein [Pseudomonadota bacterium]
MKANFVSIGAACAAVGVMLGAFGAHALRGSVGEAGLALWETATRYWFIGALGTLGFGLFNSQRASSPVPGWLLLLGSTLFSGSLYALALGGPRILGALTPFGGLGLILGFSSFAWAARGRS